MSVMATSAAVESSDLHVRWLGTVPYREALAVQSGLFANGSGQHLLLLEHPHVFTYGRRTDLSVNLHCEPAAVGAELVAVDRGGDITYHGPGQLVGLSDRQRRQPARGERPRPQRRTVADRHVARARAADGGPPPRLPGGVDRRGRTRAAQDRRNRRSLAPRPHDARVRAQRRSPISPTCASTSSRAAFPIDR